MIRRLGWLVGTESCGTTSNRLGRGVRIEIPRHVPALDGRYFHIVKSDCIQETGGKPGMKNQPDLTARKSRGDTVLT